MEEKQYVSTTTQNKMEEKQYVTNLLGMKYKHAENCLQWI